MKAAVQTGRDGRADAGFFAPAHVPCDDGLVVDRDAIVGDVEATSSDARRKAVWIASYPKSGNTWVRIFLNNLIRELRGEGAMPQSINALSDWTRLEATSPAFAAVLGKPLGDATAAEIAAARPWVQARMVHGLDKPAFIKTHSAVARVDGHPTINFDITHAAIYVVRNPLDVAVSYADFYGVSLDAIIGFMADPRANLDAAPGRAHEYMGSWSSHVGSWISVPHRPVLVLRYEDLLAAPEKTFGALASFLRLAPTAAQLGRAIEASRFARLVAQEEQGGFRERPAMSRRFFRQGRAGAWTERLTPAQARAVLEAQAPMMRRMGYLGTAFSQPVTVGGSQ